METENMKEDAISFSQSILVIFTMKFNDVLRSSPGMQLINVLSYDHHIPALAFQSLFTLCNSFMTLKEKQEYAPE
jgi:hypothetical protein